MTKAVLETLYLLLVLCVPWSLQKVVQRPGCNPNVLHCEHGGPSQGNNSYYNNLMLLNLGSRDLTNVTKLDVAALVSTMYAPTILVFEAPANSDPAGNSKFVNWTNLLDGQMTSAVAVPGIASDASVFGITFTRFYDQIKAYDLSDTTTFHWQPGNVLADKPDFLSLSLQTTPDSATNLTLLITSWPGSEGRDSDLPRLQHTPGSLQLQLLSNNTRLKAAGAFAVELNVFAYVKDGSVPPGGPGDLFKYEKSTVVDDEHSPGVFSSALVRLASQFGADTKASDKHGYFMWKPVAYDDVEKNTETVLVARTYPMTTPPYPVKSIADALVMNADGSANGKFYKLSFNVSFGESGANSNVGDQSYNTWTALIGVGEEKYDPISTGVIMAILFGLGVPLAMLILVMGYLIYWKRRQRRQPILAVGLDNPVISGPYGSDM